MSQPETPSKKQMPSLRVVIDALEQGTKNPAQIVESLRTLQWETRGLALAILLSGDDGNYQYGFAKCASLLSGDADIRTEILFEACQSLGVLDERCSFNAACLQMLEEMEGCDSVDAWDQLNTSKFQRRLDQRRDPEGAFRYFTLAMQRADDRLKPSIAAWGRAWAMQLLLRGELGLAQETFKVLREPFPVASLPQIALERLDRSAREFTELWERLGEPTHEDKQKFGAWPHDLVESVLHYLSLALEKGVPRAEEQYQTIINALRELRREEEIRRFIAGQEGERD